MTVRPRIYLAGPEVFLRDAPARATGMKEECARAGLEGVFPQDTSLRPQPGESPPAFAARIRAGNMDLIRNSDGLIANVSPFRGPNPDDGTAFEIGFAAALGLPAFCWSAEAGTLLERTRRHLPLHRDVACWRDPAGMEVEDFGLPVNLMLLDSALPPVQPGFAEAVRACAAWFATSG